MSFNKKIANSNSSKNSQELFEQAQKIVPGGVHSPVRSFKGLDRKPIFFKAAKGPYMWSVEGDKYIDYCQSFGPLLLGHLDEEVKQEVEKMIQTAWTFGTCEPYSMELAEFIIQNVPFIDKIRFVSSGTEAVMSALRLARAYTERNKVIKFEGCYHGHVDSLLVKAGSGLAGEVAASSLGVSEAVASETIVLPLNDEVALEKAFLQFGSEIAAVIIEPLPANYGLLIQRKEFLTRIQELCKKNHSVFILDEVISGFRVSLHGMAGLWNLKPDLICYGKIIGGGFPVGAYAGKKEIMDMVAPLGGVYQAGTLSANPVGMRAGLATLKKMKREDGWTRLNHCANDFYNKLKPLLEKQELTLTSYGSLFWIHEKVLAPIRSVQEIPKTQSLKFNDLFMKLLSEKVYLAPNAFEVGFVSLAHTPNVFEETLQAFSRVFRSSVSSNNI